ncbi:retrovirus-related pol polyprotein from transposon TNT 1-94 [Tanacetum coccineum]
MATMAESVIATGSENRPLMLEKGMYDSWKTWIMLYIKGKENGEMLIDSIKNGTIKLLQEITVKDTNGVTDIRRPQKVVDLSQEEKLRYDSDFRAVNIIILGLPVDIYTLINHFQTAKELWDQPGESIHSYYLRYAKLINDMKMIPMSMSNMQINIKFVNHLQPERGASLNKAMIFLSYDYISRYPPTNNQLQTSSNPRTQTTIQNRQVTVQNVQGRQSQGYAGNAGKNQASGARVVNTVGNAGTNQLRVIRCYNCNGESHIAKQCTVKKRVKDSEWFKDKMLQATTNFKAYHVDAYDSGCDDEATANAIFMANLSPVGSINDDTVEPHYDSNILSKVPHNDNNHESDVLNSDIQELEYIENIVSDNESYDELTSNNNVISYADYMVTIGNDKDNYVPPLVQNNDRILSVIEHMKTQVEKCNMVNQETQSVNESLTSELDQYKERVKTLENESKRSDSDRDKCLDYELRTGICDRNIKVPDYENQVFSQ